MSSRLRRGGAALRAAARFQLHEARGDPGLCSGQALLARNPGLLVGASCGGVAVQTPRHDMARN